MKDYYDDYDMTREDPAADLPGHTEPVIEDPVNEEELDEDVVEIKKPDASQEQIQTVLNSMSIDNKIKEYQDWKKLIDNILQELRKYDKTKLKVVEYKFFGNIPEDVIADELYVSKTTVRTYINDIYFEVGILATFNNLITKSMFSS